MDFINSKKAGNFADFCIPTVSEQEVLEIIKSLPSNVATGLDGINSSSLKINRLRCYSKSSKSDYLQHN